MSNERLNVLRSGIGRIMRQVRRDLNLTQSELAEQAEVSQTIISRAERGDINSIEHLCNIFDCMNIDIKVRFMERSKNDEERYKSHK